MNNQSRERRLWNKEEHTRENIQRQHQHNSAKQTRKGRPHPRLREYTRGPKGARAGVPPHEGSEDVGGALGEDLLRGADLVGGEAGERLCDCDVLYHCYDEESGELREDEGEEV